MRIETEAELEEILSRPSDADVAAIAHLDGDLLILGAGGKMGPSLARRAGHSECHFHGRTKIWYYWV